VRRELVIRFVYNVPEDKKRKYDEENFQAISAYLAKKHPELFTVLMRNVATNPKDNLPLIRKHLQAYVAKNTFDYFIHKDLKGFLSRELDFYIKNEILHIDDIDSEDVEHNQVFFAKIRAIKRVARILIDFLAQLEEFQKRLWLKKKFVVETNWCITLDQIDEKFYPEIAANEAQTEDWVDLFAIDQIKGDVVTPAFSRPLTVEFLKANTNLVLDTKHFSAAFKDKLVASIDNLDEKTNGVLVNSENFQATNLLISKYQKTIDCCYFDPPYNTSEASFLYKNGYKESSWATMMSNRLSLSRKLMNNTAIQCLAIDDFERPLLELVSDSVYGRDNRLGNLVVEIKPSGRTNDEFLATSHEYIVYYAINKADTSICFFPLTKEQMAAYKENSEKGAHKWRDFMRTGGYSTPEERPNSFYPIYYNEKTGEISITEQPNAVRILPIDSAGKYRVWRKTKPSLQAHLDKGEIKVIKRSNGEYKIQIIDLIKDGVRPKSVWVNSKYDASSHGTKYLKNMFVDCPFSYPKSIHSVIDTLHTVVGENPKALIFDAFAGSGTTAEAVIRLNKREEEEGNDGKRKYILVEMGEYFSTVTKPRVLKAIYSDTWKEGVPVTRQTSVPQIVKYMRLESYEDALSNVKLSKPQGVLEFDDDYLIHYMMDVESKESLLNFKKFNEPFNFMMRITEKNESKQRPIDMVETFNYLIGLTVISKSTISTFSTEKAAQPAYEGAVELRRDAKGDYSFQQLEGTLPDGRRALVIWRNVTSRILESNAALDAYFLKHRLNPQDREFDVIYVNGDNNLQNLRLKDETWKVVMTEQEFNQRMWEE
jgi:adenine-specific DNA-methyltransferase